MNKPQFLALNVDLLQLANTNAAARKIVQDFNIQWTPGPGAASPAQPLTPVPASQKK